MMALRRSDIRRRERRALVNGFLAGALCVLLILLWEII